MKERIKKYAGIITAVAMLALPVLPVAAPVASAQLTYTPLATLNIGHQGFDMAVDGNRAYVVGYDNALTAGYLDIIDISTPSAPTVASSLTLPNGGSFMFVAERAGYVYMEGRDQTLYVVDTNAASPVPVALHSCSNYTGLGGAAIAGNILAVACYDEWGVPATPLPGKIFLFDISNPAAPSLISTTDAYHPNGIAIANNRVFTVEFNNALLKAWDISNPAAPFVTGHASVPLGTIGVQASGNTAYAVARAARQLLAFDTTDASPSDDTYPQLGSYQFNSSEAFRDFDLLGSRMYLVHGTATTGSLLDIDVSNPSAMTLAGSGSGGAYVGNLSVAGTGSYIYSSGGPGLQFVVTATTPPTPTPPQGDYHDYLTFTVQTIGQGPASLDPKEGVELRVFDTDDPAFTSAYGASPAHSQYAAIYDGGIGQVSWCTTNSDGACTANKQSAGDYLVIAKYLDNDQGNTVYVGYAESASDFIEMEAYLDLKLIKKFKSGVFDSYLPVGHVQVVSGIASSGSNALAYVGLALLALAIGGGLGYYIRRRPSA